MQIFPNFQSSNRCYMLAKTFVKTPIGRFEITGTEQGIQRVQLYSGKAKASAQLPLPVQEAAKQLEEYFAGKRKRFEVKIDWKDATDFNKSVWKELLKIEYGRTISYSKIASQIDNPTAVRAVGLANKYNPIAIIVPCHRVIAKNGDLQGYFYGLEVKRYLLQLENPMSFATQGSLF